MDRPANTESQRQISVSRKPVAITTEGSSSQSQHPSLRTQTSPLQSFIGEDDISSQIQAVPTSPVRIHRPTFEIREPSSGTIENGGIRMRSGADSPEGKWTGRRQPQQSATDTPAWRKALNDHHRLYGAAPGSPDSDLQPPVKMAFRQSHNRTSSEPYKAENFQPITRDQETLNDLHFGFNTSTPTIQLQGLDGEENLHEQMSQPQLQYHHQSELSPQKKPRQRASHGTIGTLQSSNSDSQSQSSGGDHSNHSHTNHDPRPVPSKSSNASSTNLGHDVQSRGRSLFPQDPLNADSSKMSGIYGNRNLSASSDRLPQSRPLSSVDLLNISYSQQIAHQARANEQSNLQRSVGVNAAMVDPKKTLEMYRANVKKTTDMAVQYEFALLMVSIALEMDSTPPASDRKGDPKKEMLKEARSILQRLADRGYAYAQYYLADGYASGLFNNGKDDYDRAYPLFLSAGKHGHAEAAYRVALCYEFGWGCRKDVNKALQFHRQAASKGHPGAATRLGKACLTGDMGLVGKNQYREGVKWLKRATDASDAQHNSAPYELGLLHVSGYGADVFKDEAYAAQLFTQAAELGHAEASLRMGEVYEHGLLTCPRDPALSVHFYNGAAQAGVPQAMLALCAWYMVGAEPVLPKDEIEAFEWARKAANTGMTGISLHLQN